MKTVLSASATSILGGALQGDGDALLFLLPVFLSVSQLEMEVYNDNEGEYIILTEKTSNSNSENKSKEKTKTKTKTIEKGQEEGETQTQTQKIVLLPALSSPCCQYSRRLALVVSTATVLLLSTSTNTNTNTGISINGNMGGDTNNIMEVGVGVGVGIVAVTVQRSLAVACMACDQLNLMLEYFMCELADGFDNSNSISTSTSSQKKDKDKDKNLVLGLSTSEWECLVLCSEKVTKFRKGMNDYKNNDKNSRSDGHGHVDVSLLAESLGQLKKGIDLLRSLMFMTR